MDGDDKEISRFARSVSDENIFIQIAETFC